MRYTGPPAPGQAAIPAKYEYIRSSLYDAQQAKQQVRIFFSENLEAPVKWRLHVLLPGYNFAGKVLDRMICAC
jgi:hypothetical protein